MRREAPTYSGTDVLGNEYDFVLRPLPGEPSARKFIVPFRADLVERWGIAAGDLVTGRPAGPGCPLYHALRVLSANPITGVLECHTLGPLAARKEKSHDVQAYNVHAFEGIAEVIHHGPVIGKRQRFLPGYCMINLSHTAVVNMVTKETCWYSRPIRGHTDFVMVNPTLNKRRSTLICRLFSCSTQRNVHAA